MTNQTGSRSVSRRSVAKGMAWAVPAVAVGSALPASAAFSPGSCVPVPVVDPTRSCKDANEKHYLLYFMVGYENNCQPEPGFDCSITITKVEPNTGGDPFFWEGSVVGGPVLICNAGNMAGKVWVTYTITCGVETTSGRTLVQMPAWQSTTGTCTDADFASCRITGKSSNSTDTEDSVLDSTGTTAKTQVAPDTPAAPITPEATAPSVKTESSPSSTPSAPAL